MSRTTVAQFASELSKPVATLMEQLAAAGVRKGSAQEQLTEADKERLLDHLRAAHGTAGADRKKITLVKKQSGWADGSAPSGKSRTIEVQVKKPRVFSPKPGGGTVQSAAVATSATALGADDASGAQPQGAVLGSADAAAAKLRPQPVEADRRREAAEAEAARIRAMLAARTAAQSPTIRSDQNRGSSGGALELQLSDMAAQASAAPPSGAAPREPDEHPTAWKPSPADQDWARRVARRIVLQQLTPRAGTIDKAAARALEWWRLAEGGLSKVPEGAGRSTVVRIADGNGGYFFRKRFSKGDDRWEENESLNLHYIGRADGDKRQGLRQHVGWLRGTYAGEGSRLDLMETLDCGPNLEAWLSWCPTSVVEQWPIPIFAQPEFLAAVTRQTLIGLEKLSEFGVVHNDIYDRNLCLELPRKSSLAHPFQSATIELSSLTVRFIDFETAFNPRTLRIARLPDERTSPFAAACFNKALEFSEHEAAPYLSGIDFGSDLWSLGWCLREWHALASGFYQSWITAVADKFGAAHPAALGAERIALAQGTGLAMIDEFVLDLQAQDRETAMVGNREFSKRRAPHALLRSQLESKFRSIIATGKYAHREVRFIDPTEPLIAGI